MRWTIRSFLHNSIQVANEAHFSPINHTATPQPFERLPNSYLFLPDCQPFNPLPANHHQTSLKPQTHTHSSRFLFEQTTLPSNYPETSSSLTNYNNSSNAAHHIDEPRPFPPQGQDGSARSAVLAPGTSCHGPPQSGPPGRGIPHADLRLHRPARRCLPPSHMQGLLELDWQYPLQLPDAGHVCRG